MIPKTPTLPWTQCPGVAGDDPDGQAHLCVARPSGLHERGIRGLRQLLVAAEGHGFVQTASESDCAGCPSAACIHPPASKGEPTQ